MSTYYSGLIADWELIADAADSTANARNMTEHGTVVHSADGAYLHDGIEYLTRIHTTAFDIDSVDLFFGSVEVLFLTKDPNGGNNQSLITNADNFSGDDQWGVYYRPSTNEAYFYFTPDNGSNYFYAVAAMPADPTLVRHHFYFWVDLGGGTIHIQVDNNSPVSSAYTGVIGATTVPFSIGSDNVGQHWGDFKIRRARLWRGDCVLNDLAAKIAWLYNSGIGRTYADIVALGSPTCAVTVDGEGVIARLRRCS